MGGDGLYNVGGANPMSGDKKQPNEKVHHRGGGQHQEDTGTGHKNGPGMKIWKIHATKIEVATAKPKKIG